MTKDAERKERLDEVKEHLKEIRESVKEALAVLPKIQSGVFTRDDMGVFTNALENLELDGKSLEEHTDWFLDESFETFKQGKKE